MKVLYYKYYDNSGFKVVRIYSKESYKQAEEDFNLLQKHASSDKEWFLEEVPVLFTSYQIQLH